MAYDTERATKIALCESGAGHDPKAWMLSHPDGGPMQINKASWAEYFLERYGWTWDQIVLDLEIHIAAARKIYDLTDGWHRWTCSKRVLNAD